MTPGLFEHHRLIMFDGERGLEVNFFFLKQPLFSMELWPGPAFTGTPVKVGAAMASSADVSLHGVLGGGESAWILIPSGSTSFPLDCSLNTATDFKDIRLHCHSRGMKPSFLSPGCSGKRIPSNFSIKLDFLAG